MGILLGDKSKRTFSLGASLLAVAAMEYYNIAVDLLTNPKHSRWVTDCLLLGETVVCGLIIWKVSCKY
jgi:hypothetical protein